MSVEKTAVLDVAMGGIAIVASPPYRELLIHAAGPKNKQLGREERPQFEQLHTWGVAQFAADFVLPYRDSLFDEVHAYHAMQKAGRAGSAEDFFRAFTEVWRVLKPGGILAMTLPPQGSGWVWGDPGNVRAITLHTLTYLQQPEYDKQCGVTWFTDYRDIYRADFEPVLMQDDGREMRAIMRAVKPTRCAR